MGRVGQLQQFIHPIHSISVGGKLQEYMGGVEGLRARYHNGRGGQGTRKFADMRPAYKSNSPQFLVRTLEKNVFGIKKRQKIP
jgi:hypothetical protein